MQQGSVMVAIAAAFVASGCTAEPEPEGPESACGDGFTGAQSRGVEICHRSLGAAGAPTTAIVIPGGPGWGSRYLEPLADIVASDAVRAIVFDPRGVGESPAPEPPSYGLPDLAADVEAVRASSGAERIHLLAHSWGALVAYQYLQDFPDRAKGLVVVGGYGPKPAHNDDAESQLADTISFMQQNELLPDPIPTVEGSDCSTSYRARLPAYFSQWEAAIAALGQLETAVQNGEDPSAVDAWNLRPLRNTPCARDAKNGARGAIDTAGYDFGGALSAFGGPVLAIYGKNDPHDASLGNYVVGAASNASWSDYVVLPASGHLPWYEVEIADEEVVISPQRAVFDEHLQNFFASFP